jgi:hypothetical protein
MFNRLFSFWLARMVCVLGVFFTLPILAAVTTDWEILFQPANAADCLALVNGQTAAALVVDTNDFPVVSLAANFFAADVRRVTGRQPIVTNEINGAAQVVLVGTLGHSALIDRLAAAGKISSLKQISGQWERTLWQVVTNPLPGVERALVIAGSDRRGTAYGLMRLSEAIGVSPWHWWADVPTPHHDELTIKMSWPTVESPGVKYRGIFINDEDWGLNPWAAKTFDPGFKNIGPRTYEKMFELLLRLRLNYFWPAMHACSTEFGSAPENVLLADKFGLVAGSSHCEPMLCNNVHWNETENGRWNYRLNRDTIYSYWEKNAKARGSAEAVWTLGIRGIHDAGMQTPPTDTPGKINLLSDVFHDQRELLEKYAATNFSPVAQCFVPYKEVLPVYDAGLPVPEDVTLVWVDDNFGYLRRLSSPAERQRSGGAGVYWHLSYYGNPHSYTWINTTAPALMWEELHKAWDNDARNLWVINVGDLKPMEIGVDYFSRLAWHPDGFPDGGQREFLRDFAAKNFGEKFSQPMTELLMEFYRLGTIRKPELMNRDWALALTPGEAQPLEKNYRDLLARAESLLAALPPENRDAGTELVVFPARVLGLTGLIFLADRQMQVGNDMAANEKKIAQWRGELETQVNQFNTNVAGGKWNRIMPGLVTGKDLTRWSSQVRWPWGEKTSPATNLAATTLTEKKWREAAAADHRTTNGPAQWSEITGLGPSGRAVALLPAGLASTWTNADTNAPALEFYFTSTGGDGEALIDFLPTFRLFPGMKLRVSVSLDDGVPVALEVPGSSGAENETGTVRSSAVQNNFVRARVPLPALTAGPHIFRLRAMDSGAVIDRISLP